MKLTTENREIIAGAFLVLLLGSILMFVHSRAAIDKNQEAFYLYAPFSKADGLMNGADVRVAGLKVGRVTDQILGDNYQVLVKMGFARPLELSVDSSAVIETDGLLGSKYLEIIPGADDELLGPGDVLDYTQDAIILTELMDKVNAYMREKKQSETVQTEAIPSAVQQNPNTASVDETETITQETINEEIK